MHVEPRPVLGSVVGRHHMRFINFYLLYLFYTTTKFLSNFQWNLYEIFRFTSLLLLPTRKFVTHPQYF